jgi:NAD-dependent DNA ligase
VRRWQQRDDVYQVGQLIAMLLRGDTASSFRSKDVRRLECSDHLKEIIHRCLGVRGKRYESAEELITALHHRPRELRAGRVATLDGKTISFTGFLTRPRADAIRAAKRAGATVQSKPGLTTDILVVGRPNALQIAGTRGGTKLLEVRRLEAKGHRVAVIHEKQFWRLADRARASTRRKRSK